MNSEKKSNKQLSIIIPAYNIEKYICQCVDSILKAQEVADLVEVIIVNDGSSDNTLKIAMDYQNKYSDIVVVVDKQNGGHGSAINAGIGKATGKYVKVVDGDDWVLEEGLTELVNFINKGDSAPDIIVNPYEMIYDTPDKNMIQEFPEFTTAVTYDFASLNQKKRYLEMHAITYRADVLKMNSITIDEKMFYVDTEYILFPVPYVSSIVFLPSIVYQYRLGNADQSVSIKNMQKNRDMHKRVIMSLLKYYTAHKESFDTESSKYYLFRVGMMTTAQANIYCLMDDLKLAKQEMKLFVKEYDDYKKKNHIDRKVDFTVNKRIPFLRLTRFMFFESACKYYRKKNGYI